MAKTLLKSLIEIQQTLIAPKNCYNQFGRYKYRNLEAIEEAIKPLLKERNCGIRFADEIVEHCGRTFLRTTLTLFNIDGEEISTTAEAEHAIEQKGMDKSQLTGCASSYARKYAMNAMFAIDDTKDADTDEFHNQTHQMPAQPQSQVQQPAPKPASRSRKTPAPEVASVAQNNASFGSTLDILPNDPYAGIKQILANLQTIDDMMNLYQEHKNEVESNADIKTLFGIRKGQIKKQTA